MYTDAADCIYNIRKLLRTCRYNQQITKFCTKRKRFISTSVYIIYETGYARVPRWSPMNKLAYPGTIAATMQTRLDSGDSQ